MIDREALVKRLNEQGDNYPDPSIRALCNDAAEVLGERTVPVGSERDRIESAGHKMAARTGHVLVVDEERAAASGLSHPPRQGELCSDCPPVGYPTDKTRCLPCPRRQDGAREVEWKADWEAIAFNLCSEFGSDFVEDKHEFAKAVVREYLRSLRRIEVPEQSTQPQEAVDAAYKAACAAMPSEVLSEIAPGELERVVRAVLATTPPAPDEAEFWCRLLGEALDALDECAGDDEEGWDRQEHAHISAEAIRAKYKNRPASTLPAPDEAVEERELIDALAFFDRVKSSSQREQIAVGQDHWNRLNAATRAMVALLRARSRRDVGGV